MKKVIGFISLATLALAMFFNTSLIKKNNNTLSLTSLLQLNTAQASSELDDETILDLCKHAPDMTCDIYDINSGTTETVYEAETKI